MHIARSLLVLSLAVPLFADPIGDVRAALAKLTAQQPIRATYELQHSVVSEGKFDNDKFSGKAVVGLESDGGEVRIILPKVLLEQVSREHQARTTNVETPTPTANALAEIDTVETSNALDCAPMLLRLIHGAKLLSDAQGTFQGKPVRVLVLRVEDRIEKEDKGRVKMGENKLTLWLGPDLVPVGAEHLVNAKISVLFLKAESKQKKSWYFTQVADRLVRVRHESTQSGSGMGQKSNETVISTVRVH
ncbi:MAG TPA: hypothetical protein VEK79_25250 [Thermoanaerobaculia bacterium]|nr:hypothetical protein [Thermoanaerobaculia bacterium]